MLLGEYANGIVISLSLSRLSPEIADISALPTPRDLDGGSPYRWIERECGIRIAGGTAFIEAVNEDAQVAGSLNVGARAAVLPARRTSRSADGVPIEYAMLHYWPDPYRFRAERTRP